MHRFIVVSFMILGMILSPFSVYAECTPSPKEIAVVDAAIDVAKARAVFSSNNNTFTLNLPAYCEPVDIYFAIATPEGKLIFVDSNGKLTLDYAPYTAGSKSAVNTSFSVADSTLVSEIKGECILYWLVAPANGSNLIKSIEGAYELGFYMFDVGFIQNPDDAVITAQLKDVAIIQFTSDVLSQNDNVEIKKTNNIETEEIFDELADFYSVKSRVSYEVRVVVDDINTAANINITLNVPDDFLASIPSGYQPRLFVQLYQDGGNEILDNFQLYPSTFDSNTKTIQATLPAYVFTNQRRSDAKYEAVFTIAITPEILNKSNKVAIPNVDEEENECIECKAKNNIACPLSQDCNGNITSHFGSRNGSPHTGVDFGLSVGTPIYASADGKMEKVQFNHKIIFTANGLPIATQKKCTLRSSRSLKLR